MPRKHYDFNDYSELKRESEAHEARMGVFFGVVFAVIVIWGLVTLSRLPPSAFGSLK